MSLHTAQAEPKAKPTQAGAVQHDYWSDYLKKSLKLLMLLLGKIVYQNYLVTNH